MSFTSTFPSNMPKYSSIVGIPTVILSIDAASGADYNSLTWRELPDYGVGVDLSNVRHVLGDLSVGVEASSLRVRAVDLGAVGELVQYISRVVFDKAVFTDVISAVTRTLFDSSISKELAAPMVSEIFPDPESAVEKCINDISRLYSEVYYRADVRSTHCTVVHDCILSMLSLVSFKLQEMTRVGVVLSSDIYDQFKKCWHMASSYRRPRPLDVVIAEDDNELVNMLKCTEELLSKLPPFLTRSTIDLGVARDFGRYIDVTSVSDRLIYRPRLIEYFTDRLSPPGGYVLKPPPTFREALVVSAYGVRALIYNISKGNKILWEDIWQNKPCTYVYIYADGWVIVWFEDLCFYARPDWDYNDVAVAFRFERLNGVVYLHFLALDHSHADTDIVCIEYLGVEKCSPDIGYYFGPVRVVYEEWFAVR